jgi:UDP-N-acetylmuramyl pentapeptide phosphotransferase/UDP-N-acetylglucosamine-1-phosphate transferase
LVSLLALLLIPLYFKFAKRWNLIDLPGERKSHNQPTLRGVGIIYPIVILTGSFFFEQLNAFLVAGLVLGASTGFMDDKFGLSALLRATLYAVSVALTLYTIPDTYIYQNWQIAIIFIIALGTVNAYNFMDGINGLTILYSALFIVSIYGLSSYFNYNIPENVLGICIVVTVILGFLNVRTNARAFIGDVGSVFLGLFAIYWVVYLTTHERSPVYLLLLLVYGIDTVITIAERVFKRQNIFVAHRLHLYQLLSNELKWPHLKVSIIYTLVQLLINGILFFSVLNHWNGTITLIATSTIIGAFYLVIKYGLIFPKIQIAHSQKQI